MKDEFDQQTRAATEPAPQTRSTSSPEKLIAQGITTPETLDYMSRHLPSVPHAEPSPDDPAGWRTAIANADAGHARLVGSIRARFEARFSKFRADFDRAQTISPLERGAGIDQEREL